RRRWTWSSTCGYAQRSDEHIATLLKGRAPMKRLHLLIALGLFVSVGCGEKPVGRTANRSAPGEEVEADKARVTRESEKSARAPQAEVAQAPAAGQAAGGAPAEKKAEPLVRKIIYTADVRLIVDDFQKAEAELLQLIKAQTGGYVAKSEIT